MSQNVAINQVTSQLDITSRTLRYWEETGLIESSRDPQSNWRMYDEKTIERLKQIMILRKMQISIKDIIRIYESEDMSVIVQVFVDKINQLDDQINTLNELKGIVDDFLQIMLKNGIEQISALPLLYEKMEKELENSEESKAVTYEELSAVSK